MKHTSREEPNMADERDKPDSDIGALRVGSTAEKPDAIDRLMSAEELPWLPDDASKLDLAEIGLFAEPAKEAAERAVHMDSRDFEPVDIQAIDIEPVDLNLLAEPDEAFDPLFIEASGGEPSIPPEMVASVTAPVAEEGAAESVSFAAGDGLAARLKQLEMGQAEFSQSFAAKADWAEVSTLRDEWNQWQSEQARQRRNKAADVAENSVWTLAALGLAAAALLLAGAAGYFWRQQNEVTSANSEQLAQLAQQLTDIQSEQAEGAGKDIDKKLAELAAAQAALSTQVADLQKSLKADAAGKQNVNLNKQLAELAEKSKRTDLAVEALENRLVLLDKARASAPPPQQQPQPKPVAAKAEETADAGWAVSLCAFKQDWYAKRVADDYAGKGVRAKISKMPVKGDVWYRLSVDGFKTQAEANAYAAKVKKLLNLDSVAVMHADGE